MNKIIPLLAFNQNNLVLYSKYDTIIVESIYANKPIGVYSNISVSQNTWYNISLNIKILDQLKPILFIADNNMNYLYKYDLTNATILHNTIQFNVNFYSSHYDSFKIGLVIFNPDLTSKFQIFKFTYNKCNFIHSNDSKNSNNPSFGLYSSNFQTNHLDMSGNGKIQLDNSNTDSVNNTQNLNGLYKISNLENLSELSDLLTDQVNINTDIKSFTQLFKVLDKVKATDKNIILENTQLTILSDTQPTTLPEAQPTTLPNAQTTTLPDADLTDLPGVETFLFSDLSLKITDEV